jgi:hypothetical protein
MTASPTRSRARTDKVLRPGGNSIRPSGSHGEELVQAPVFRTVAISSSPDRTPTV